MAPPRGSIPWNAGTGKGWTDKRGYRWVYIFENGKRRAKREHRHVMEKHLGRKLRPEEVVHHVNEDTSDNRIENLQVQEWSEHTMLHSNGRRHAEYTRRTQAVIAEYREENKRLLLRLNDLLVALKALQLQALQSTVNDPANEWGQEALALARAAIAAATGSNHER